MTRADQLLSIRFRVAGMLPPGSPATISVCTVLSVNGFRSPCEAATSASHSAYVGVQQTTEASIVSIRRSRRRLDMPPPGTHCAPMRDPASNASQKPRNGPNENGKKMRSPGPTCAARKTVFQQSSNHCQFRSVSHQRKGLPLVDDVWQ